MIAGSGDITKRHFHRVFDGMEKLHNDIADVLEAEFSSLRA